MATQVERVTIKTLKEVGRYAIGIDWLDGHESILPYRQLRQHCPCEVCGTNAGVGEPSAHRVDALQRLGEATLFVRWGDGHETLYVAEELRALCRCAHCAGEPDYPITRQ